MLDAHIKRSPGPHVPACIRRLQRTRAIAAGTTLLELTIACSILLILATVAVPLTRITLIRRNEDLLRYDLREMRDAIDRYKDDADKKYVPGTNWDGRISSHP
jgi:type II secretory pathway pseudopilin PulG